MKLHVRYPAVLGTSIVAGVFALIVSLLLIIDFVGRGSLELFDAPQYLELKEQLKASPTDPQLQESIRQLDLQLRESYFNHRRSMIQGVYLLIGGVVLCLVTARWAAAMRFKLPRPEAREEEVDYLQREQQLGKRGAIVLIVTLLVLMSAFALKSDRILPTSIDDLADNRVDPKQEVVVAKGASVKQKAKQAVAPDKPRPAAKTPTAVALPSYEEYLTQWPRFRGPTGSGKTALTDIPQKWNGNDGSGIVWKVPVPLPGLNSPVVWKNRVFLSGATVDEQAVFCFDTAKGELLWRLDVPLDLGGVEELEVADYTGYAASTTATDGVRIYAIFASGNLVAADFQGQQLWRKNLGVPKNNYGHASSLATHKDLVIVQFDQGTAKDDTSKLIAFQGGTGDVAWEVARPVPSSWATPIVVEHGGRTMVITCVEPWVIAYHADDGQELWRAECLGGEVGPSPVFANGVVYVANEASGSYAVRTDGEGDVTETHIEWFTDIEVPDVCSPLVLDECLIQLAHGYLTSMALGKSDDLEEPREPLWEEDLEEEVSSSPSLAGDLIYLFAEEGKVWIVKHTPDACQRVAECEMGEPVRTSPAVLPGRIYIRGDEHLFCIGK